MGLRKETSLSWAGPILVKAGAVAGNSFSLILPVEKKQDVQPNAFGRKAKQVKCFKRASWSTGLNSKYIFDVQLTYKTTFVLMLTPN